MGDSDDDFDSRRNREKFRRERDDFNGNRAGDWNDGRFRRQYSGVPPPNKRFHRDFSSQRDESNQTFNAPIKESIETTSQPTFLTFKNFLLEQDDNIDQEEAVKLYSIYKNNFQKTQLAEFFSAHKNDDWFKFKYHPDEYPKRIEEQKLIIEKRRNIFIELYNNGHLDNLSLDISNEKDLIKYLDTIVMKLEGVNESDIRMTSIFFRQLTMKTTKDELENLCKIYDGFRRICLTDPIPERKFFRRAWATFDFNVEIRNICYELSSIKLHDLDMGVIVNRELKTRLRTVDLFNHEYDLNMVIKITQQLDKQSKISSNLLLENLDKNTSLKNLDYLILYLRIVYSFDYYNGSEYLQEDSMPNRCGVLHVRSLTNTSNSIELIDARLKTFMDNHEIIDDNQAKQLGRKNEQDEIEQFIKDNCQEISKDKWSCPLSGKKFKGPEFVRKHILNKYQDKLDEIKKQVEYFNNYLYDPKRPQYSLNQSHPSGLPLPIPMGIRPTFVPNYFPNSYRHSRPQFMHHGGPRPSNNRPMRNYEDLDAPTEF